MKTIANMTDAEIIENGIFNAGTDKYIIPRGKKESDRQLKILQEYQKAIEIYKIVKHNKEVYKLKQSTSEFGKLIAENEEYKSLDGFKIT